MPRIELKDVVVSYPRSRILEEKRLRFQVQKHLRSLFRGAPQHEEQLLALQDVSLRAEAGDVVGIVGPNGAGKTTLLRVIGGLLRPDSGQVDVEGSVSSVFSLGGFKPVLSGRENIYLVGALYGLSKSQTAKIERQVIEVSGLGDSIDYPLKTYSRGLKARLGFALVSCVETGIVILDEALAAGDQRFRRKASTLIQRFSGEDRIVLIASHSRETLERSCTVVHWLENGRICASGEPGEVLEAYEIESKKDIDESRWR